MIDKPSIQWSEAVQWSNGPQLNLSERIARTMAFSAGFSGPKAMVRNTHGPYFRTMAEKAVVQWSPYGETAVRTARPEGGRR